MATLVDYLRGNDHAVRALADLPACARVAAEAVEDAAAERLAYLELRFSPLFMARPHGLVAAEVVAAVVDGAGAAERATGLRTTSSG